MDGWFAKSFQPNAGTDDIYDGINASHFVKMNFSQCYPVDFGFSPANPPEDGQ